MNQLQFEPSPYLRLHATNPINWYSWGSEALEKAKSDDKPIFLSIGYSTCHWCHVMNRESFMDEQVGKLLNEHFIPVKVDREQHPDVDAVYMDACVKMTGSGGWPLSVFLTPDLNPFFAGTYFPKESTLRSMGFISLLKRIAHLWETDRDSIADIGKDSVAENLEQEREPSIKFRLDIATEQVDAMKRRYDPRYGGFLPAPKFPQLHQMLMFLNVGVNWDDNVALDIAVHTLKSLLAKGLYDQVGGGLYRYSTDAEFKIPHFEKMLYDNAFLLYTLGEFYLATKDPYFKEKALDVFGYLESNLKSPDGGYYTAQDADSEEGEGAFYLYTKKELVEVLSQSEFEVLAKHYEILEGGNFEGKIHLFPKSDEAFRDLTSGKDSEKLKDIYKKLNSYRIANRTPPFTDKKILVFANGLLLCGLAKTSHLDEKIKKASIELYEYLKNIANAEKLPGALMDGKAISKGHLDDFAFLTLGFLEFGLRNSGKMRKDAIHNAVRLTEKANDLFFDAARGGYYTTSADTILPSRPKSVFEGAIPEGNSVMCMVLFRLFQITGSLPFREYLEKTLNQAMSLLNSYPTGAPFLSLVGDWYLNDFYEIVLTGSKGNQQFLDKIRSKVGNEYLAGHLFWIVDSTQPKLYIEADKPDTELGLYLCTGGSCEAKISSETAILEKLHELFQRNFSTV